MRVIATILLCLAALCGPGGQAAAQVPVDDTANLHATWRDRILQVQVIDRQASSKAGIGSGFFAGQPGWVVTNYHVIAELANQPGKYEARYLADDGSQGPLELLAVDAVHDLAVLRAPGLEREPLPLADTVPPRGSRLYSMGYPFDIGLTIVEGTFNGMLERSLYEKLHFTGSINPGMSGGPALNHSGEVVGVNVSTAGNQVSFLVPARYVEQMLRSAGADALGPDELNTMVARQLLDNQEQITRRLLQGDLPHTRLDGYRVPAAMAPWINCWGNSQDDDPDELSVVFYRCESEDDIFLSGSLYTGVVRYQHDLLSAEELHPLRFYRQIEQQAYYPQLRLEGDERTVTNYRCRSNFVEVEGNTFKATLCARRYRHFTGLYDAYLSLTSLVDDREALQSTLVLAGFSWENIERISSEFMGSLRRSGHPQ